MEDVITIRRATEQDRSAIARLAALDSRPPPRGELLLALVEGELRAALSVGGGELVANPFRPTEPLAELLRLRAAQERTPGLAQPPERGLREVVRSYAF
jgi:hypothetical protein